MRCFCGCPCVHLYEHPCASMCIYKCACMCLCGCVLCVLLCPCIFWGVTSCNLWNLCSPPAAPAVLRALATGLPGKSVCICIFVCMATHVLLCSCLCVVHVLTDVCVCWRGRLQCSRCPEDPSFIFGDLGLEATCTRTDTSTDTSSNNKGNNSNSWHLPLLY